MSGSGEWTAYAVSKDGLHYEDLLGGAAVFDPKEHARIEGGTRDAYICRSHDGKKFLMVTTDMCVAKTLTTACTTAMPTRRLPRSRSRD